MAINIGFNNIPEGYTAIVYGKTGSGKTTLLGYDPLFQKAYGEQAKILLIDVEHSANEVLKGVSYVDPVFIETWEDLQEVADSLIKGFFLVNGQKIQTNVYKWIVIDSASRIMDLVKEHTLRNSPRRARSVEGIISSQADWGELLEKYNKMTRVFHAIAKNQEITKRNGQSHDVFFILHPEDVQDENNITKTRPALQGRNTTDSFMALVDGVFYLDKIYKGLSDNKPQYLRQLYTEDFGKIQAKHRVPITKERLPNPLVNPSMVNILYKLGYINKSIKNNKKEEVTING